MAKNKSINVILNLKDKFTKPIQKSASEAKKFERQVKRVENNITKSTKKMVKDFNDMSANIAKSAGKLTLKGLTIGGGLSVAGVTAGMGAGLAEGLDYEGYRAQLETATGDTKKASDLMRKSIAFANKTPFEAGQIIEATSKFEAMGVSSEKWLAITADMAGSTSKDIIQAVEAVIDAVASGEFERLKEFGIRKDALAGFDKAGKMVDQTAMMNSLMEIMEDRYKGGAEKLAKTTKGMWSTVTGVFKNSMAKIVGITDEGTVRSGSLLDKFKNIVQSVADKFLEWQSNGTIEKIAQELDTMISKAISGFKTMVSAIGQVITKVKEFLNSAKFDELISKLRVIAPIIMAIIVAQKLWTAGIKLHKMWLDRQAIAQGVVNSVTKIWNMLAVANPWGLVLTAVIAILLLVALNYDKIKAKVLELWAKWQSIWNNIKTFTSDVITSIKEKFDGVWTGLKEGVKGFANFFIEKINACSNKINGLLNFKMPKFLGGAEISLGKIPTIPEFATGTSYHRGGLARINEGGRGEIVNLPNGTQVVPNSISKQSAGQNTTVTVPITVQGNIYGDRELVDRVGGLITQRIKLAIGNV